MLLHRFNAQGGYSESVVVDPTGAVVQTLVLLYDYEDAQVVDAQRLLVQGMIVSLTTGDRLWSSFNSWLGMGAATATNALFISDNLVRIEPY